MKKTCTCCKENVDSRELKFIGTQHGRTFDLDLYNCNCGTTLGFRVEKGGCHETNKPSKTVELSRSVSCPNVCA